MGKGIGFKAKEGDVVSKKRIEKIFIMDGKSSVDKFKQLVV